MIVQRYYRNGCLARYEYHHCQVLADPVFNSPVCFQNYNRELVIIARQQDAMDNIITRTSAWSMVAKDFCYYYG